MKPTKSASFSQREFHDNLSAYGCRQSLRLWVVSVVFALLYAASLILGWNLTRYGACQTGAARTWLAIGLLAAVVSVMSYFLLRLISFHRFHLLQSRSHKDMQHPVLATWLVLCLAWLPVVIARWPGDFSFDAMWQTAWILPESAGVPEYWAEINGWHPPLHSLWLGGSVALGKSLFHSYSVGLALYTVSQMLIFSWCVARVVAYAYETKHVVLYVVSLAFAALFSGFSVYVTMTTKDVVFSGILALSSLWVYRTVREDHPPRLYWLWMVQGSVLFLFAILMRNNALHAYLIFAVIALIAHMAHRFNARLVFAALVPAIAIALFITGPFYRLLGIDPGPSKEMMSVPAVQLSSVMVDHASDLTEDDRAYIELLIPDWAKYDHDILADQTKQRFKTDLVKDDPIRFMRVYLSLALRYPGDFFNAWALLSAGYWSQSTTYFDESAAVTWPLMCPYDAVRAEIEPFLSIPFEIPVPELSKALDSFLMSHVEAKIPVVNLLYKASTWFWIAIAFVFVSIAFRVPMGHVMPVVILLGYCLTLLLGPGSLYRYASPLFVSIPLLLVMFCDVIAEARQMY